MALTVQRDAAVIRAGLERWLGRPVGQITRPAPGWSCETLVIDNELVIRLPPAGDGIFPDYDLAQQAAVQSSLSEAGVPVPAPVTHEPDPSFLGAPFIAMPFVEGVIISEYTPGDDWLRALPDDASRHTVWESFLAAVVAIHSASWRGFGLRRGLDAELDFWSEYLEWAADGSSPTARLAEVLAWCRANRPNEEPACGLLWGDVRLGNVVFDPNTASPRAVLDWDMVSAGPVEMDLAWFLALDTVQVGLTGESVAGFGSREDAVSLVEGALGRSLIDLDWYEVFALVRASAVSTRIAILFERAGQRSMFKPGEGPTLDAAIALIERRS